MRQFIDLPPVWLAACGVAAWLTGGWFAWGYIPGTLLLIIAIGLTLAAVFAFHRARTTIIPHRTATALISDGIFRWSRNPIYLADLLILAGISLIWGSWLGLVLVPVLYVILTQRFILGEEDRLRAEFGSDFDDYAEKVRRWI